MAALTTDRNTPRRDGNELTVPVAAATVIYGGALVCRDVAGNGVNGATSTTLKALGRASERVDNSTGIAGVRSIRVEIGVFRFQNSTAGDLIAALDIGNDCFIVDNQTVAKTNGGATRSRAGRIVDVEAVGVWVLVGPQF